MQKKLSRGKSVGYVANLPPCLIGMEAYASSNRWYRIFTEMGHIVRLIAPQLVKPFVKSNNKNDAIDAEALCEAVQRPKMRFVSPKSIEQQDIRSIHRIREGAIRERTRQANRIRGLSMKYGIIIPQGINHSRKRIPEIIEDEENGLTMWFRRLLSGLHEEMLHKDERIASSGGPRVFKNARELAAWLGLVPRQHSTGGKTTLGEIRQHYR
uniref:Transposase n=1 Tax=Candidatus Kentrum sp. TC TaxID=2126339 RepID=A0A451A967_9GAMM|nr:MAG: transposase [Candidatus Kentron sp. TC]